MDAVADAKPVKVLYKDPEGINAFCINKVRSLLTKGLFDSSDSEQTNRVVMELRYSDISTHGIYNNSTTTTTTTITLSIS